MTTADELAVLHLVNELRTIEPAYASGRPMRTQEVQAIVAALGIDVFRMESDSLALLSPFIEGVYYLALSTGLHRGADNFVQLHECMHVIRGDVLEPTRMDFTGDYPLAEKYCDVAALLGVMPAVALEQGAEGAESWIRSNLEIEDKGWIYYRVPDLAPRVVAAWEFIRRDDGALYDQGQGVTRVRTRSRWRKR